MTHSHNQRKKEPMPEQPEEQQAPQPGVPAISVNLTPQGMIISSVVAAINEDMMYQIVVKWLETHPDLLQALTKQTIQSKRNDLAIVQHVKRTRND